MLEISHFEWQSQLSARVNGCGCVGTVSSPWKLQHPRGNCRPSSLRLSLFQSSPRTVPTTEAYAACAAGQRSNMSKRSAPPKRSIWSKGDLVEVMCTDDSMKVGIIVQVKHLLVTSRLEGGGIYEGPGMTIHNVDEGLSSGPDGSILQWQKINKDNELPENQYKSRLKRYDKKTADLSFCMRKIYIP
mmetsp:Transcript_21630/g.39236  ORF Transcript_21630/g.39236 Transcript_21630/m.39236 type:complete len:187 (+) Transcript_21630:179-739(+)